MKRPAGVTASAILLILLTLLLVGMALLMALAGFAGPKLNSQSGTPTPPFLSGMMYAMGAVCLCFAGWSVATTEGLFRLRRWSRISVAIIGGCLALFGGFAALGMVAAVFIPLPQQPGLDPAQATTAVQIARAMFVVMAAFYFALAGIGIWWLVYFNLKRTRMVFAGVTFTAGTDANATYQDAGFSLLPSERRPVLISVYCVFMLLGAIFCVGTIFLPYPAMLFGFILHGWAAKLVYAAFVALATAISIGLWKLKEWARLTAIGYQVFGLLNCGFMLFRPSLMQRQMEEANRAMGFTQPTNMGNAQGYIVNGLMGLTALLLVAIIFMLHYYRDRFRPFSAGPATGPNTNPPAPAPAEPATAGTQNETHFGAIHDSSQLNIPPGSPPTVE